MPESRSVVRAGTPNSVPRGRSVASPPSNRAGRLLLERASVQLAQRRVF